MNCDDVRARHLDHLDDLLAPDVSREVAAHLATCASCRAAVAPAAAAHARLLAPYPVPEPTHDLSAAVRRAAAARRRPVARQPVAAWTRYAAAFAAGVLVTLAVQPLASSPAGPPPSPHPPLQAASTVEVPTVPDTPPHLRRIR